MMDIKSIALSDIGVDSDIQPRVALSPAVIQRYSEVMRDGGELPPVVVFLDGDGYYLLSDGFHRYHAALRTGAQDIRAEIRSGDRRDAILYAVGANATHGLPRTDEDKRRAVEMMLDDLEWRTWNNSAIARQCGVAHSFVAKVRQSYLDSNQDSAPRKVERGGTVYTMDTTNIGKSPRPIVSTFIPDPDEPTDLDDASPSDDWDRETPDQVFAQADFYELPSIEPAPQRPAAIVPIDRSEQGDPGELLSAVLDRNPDVRDRLDAAVLSTNFAKAIRLIRDHLFCLNPEMLGEMETEQSGYATRAFISDTRRWLDRLEVAMQGGLRAVK